MAPIFSPLWEMDPNAAAITNLIAANNFPISYANYDNNNNDINSVSTSNSINRNTTNKRARAKKYKCPYCWVVLSNTGQLRGHIRIHTGERPFKCESCQKTFTRNEELTRHRRIHTGQRPFACHMCLKRFGRRDHLKKHIRTHERKLYNANGNVKGNGTGPASGSGSNTTANSNNSSANINTGFDIINKQPLVGLPDISNLSLSSNENYGTIKEDKIDLSPAAAAAAPAAVTNAPAADNTYLPMAGILATNTSYNNTNNINNFNYINLMTNQYGGDESQSQRNDFIQNNNPIYGAIGASQQSYNYAYANALYSQLAAAAAAASLPANPLYDPSALFGAYCTSTAAAAAAAAAAAGAAASATTTTQYQYPTSSSFGLWDNMQLSDSMKYYQNNNY